MDQPRDPPAPIVNHDVGKQVDRYRRHSPVSGVGVARRSYGYAVFALRAQGSQARNATPPWIRGCGDRYAARHSSSTGF
jgi:hypothetical protein